MAVTECSERTRGLFFFCWGGGAVFRLMSHLPTILFKHLVWQTFSSQVNISPPPVPEHHYWKLSYTPRGDEPFYFQAQRGEVTCLESSQLRGDRVVPGSQSLHSGLCSPTFYGLTPSQGSGEQTHTSESTLCSVRSRPGLRQQLLLILLCTPQAILP